MKTYRCPNGCSVSDSYKRCNRCGHWLLYDGNNEMEEIEKKSKEISLGSLPSSIHTPEDIKDVLKSN